MSAIRVADYMELNHFFYPVIFQFYSKESFLKVMDKNSTYEDYDSSRLAIVPLSDMGNRGKIYKALKYEVIEKVLHMNADGTEPVIIMILDCDTQKLKAKLEMAMQNRTAHREASGVDHISIVC